MRLFVFVSFVVLLCGCRASLGECDEQNLPIVFEDSQDGFLPIYAGQALMVENCANGQCHAVAAMGEDRMGAPIGMDFDFGVACVGEDPSTPDCIDGQNRLALASHVSFDYRRLSWSQIEEGDMPPTGVTSVAELSQEYVETVSPTGTPGHAMPGLGSPIGQDRLRNWFACGAPVVGHARVERPAGKAAGEECAEDTYGACRYGAPAEPPPEPEWPEIFSMFRRFCASGCHEPGGTFEVLPFVDEMEAYDALVHRPAMSGCDPAILVDPGNAESLLLQLLSEDGATCDTDRMPQNQDPLRAELVAPIREWIVNNDARRVPL